MIGVCVSKVLLPWLSAFVLTGHPDALQLAQAADMFAVPRSVMWATAWAETRYNAHNTAVSAAGAVGRMQILPRAWAWQCGGVYGRRRYSRNIHCGALVLRYYLSRCAEDVTCAAFRYVGGDSTYAKEVGFRSLVLDLKVRAVWPGGEAASLLPP